MGSVPAWHARAVEQLSQLFYREPDAMAFVLSGSLAATNVQEDLWSDVDASVIVVDHALERYCLSTGWLRSFGQIVGKERHENHLTSCEVFDDLAAEILPGYKPRGPLLLPSIESARQICSARAGAGQ